MPIRLNVNTGQLRFDEPTSNAVEEIDHAHNLPREASEEWEEDALEDNYGVPAWHPAHRGHRVQ